jgi:hypothetical protein
LNIYIGKHLAGIIYILNFGILIDDEVYSQYGSREDRKKLALIREFTGNMGVSVIPDLNTAGGESASENMIGTDKLTIQNHNAALAYRHRGWPWCCCIE